MEYLNTEANKERLPPELDLEALFVTKMNCDALQITEFYRKAAIVFRLRKPESRQLLKRLCERGLATHEGKIVTFKLEAAPL